MAFEDYVGKQFGNYQIIELVGKGGMAGVFRAHQPSTNRDVALKIMAAQYSEDELFVARFKNEAQLIAQLEHAYILPVYDFGEQDGVLFIVMRLLSGGDLADRVDDGPMNVEDAVPIFKQLAAALDYAHSKGVIHRDLKPSNVMIDSQGTAYLTDFGIAKTIEGAQNLTGTGGVVGTPTYMSPEQGMGDAVDARSDIYSVGVMLFEMLTGKPPFEGDNPMAVMLKHINEQPPNPTALKPDLSQAVSNVVLKALSKEAADRYTSAREMADALEKASRGGAVEAPLTPAVLPSARDYAAGTMPVQAAAPQEGMTMPSPVIGRPQAETAAGVAAPMPTTPPTAPAEPTIPKPAAPQPAVADVVKIEFNPISAWVSANEKYGVWVQAILLSLATWIFLNRLAPGGIVETGLLSLIPGVLVYGLLRGPTIGALLSLVLILVPLVAHTPGLAVLWLVLIVVSGSRLNSREIMLIVVTAILAGTPLGWMVPLAGAWWLRSRRTLLPSALGVTIAMLMALTLGWSNAGGLLPTPIGGGPLSDAIFLSPLTTNYLGLLEPSTWAPWSDLTVVVDTISATFGSLGDFFAQTSGLPLLIATGWAIAATVSESNRRVQSMPLRALGLGLGLLVLLAVHLLPSRDGLEKASAISVAVAVVGAFTTFFLTQWPLQIDPNKGNLPGTVMHSLRRSLGAFYMALGVAYFAGLLADSPFYGVMWMVGTFGTLTMITNALIGPPLVFAALVVTLFPMAMGGPLADGKANPSAVLAIITAVLLMGYMVVNMIFDRRRPRRWNPLGAGLMLGAPGLGNIGLLPLGVVSLGTLEAQVPATILALLSHILLIVSADPPFTPVQVIVQLVTTMAGVLTIERLMGTGLLRSADIEQRPQRHKVRRLIFTLVVMVIMALLYSLGGGMRAGAGTAALLAIVSGAWLVAALGDRAMLWRAFVEREEKEEELAEDEEVTGPWQRQQA